MLLYININKLSCSRYFMPGSQAGNRVLSHWQQFRAGSAAWILMEDVKGEQQRALQRSDAAFSSNFVIHLLNLSSLSFCEGAFK